MEPTTSMWMHPGGCLYRGAHANTAHAAHCVQLLIPTRGQLELSVDGVRYHLPAGAALLIPADLEQRMFVGAPRVTLMFDPELAGARLLGFATSGAAMVLSGAQGQRMREFAAALEAAPLADEAALESVFQDARTLLSSLGLGAPARLDPRVEAALELFRQPWLGLTHTAVSRRAAIAPDHLSHLFRAQLGISARRYCLWARSVAAIEQMVLGCSATQAAERTGFADLAHFSRTARRYHGLPPSRLPTAHTRVFAGVYGSEASLGPAH